MNLFLFIIALRKVIDERDRKKRNNKPEVRKERIA